MHVGDLPRVGGGDEGGVICKVWRVVGEEGAEDIGRDMGWG